MMKSDSKTLTIGYDLDIWQGYGKKEPITIDISLKTNFHTMICGMSGSGKSTCESLLFARLILAYPEGEFYFIDFKQEDSFAYLRGCARYYPYKDSIEALNIVYAKLQARQSGDPSRNPVVLIWDEYVANILSLMSQDKKKASIVMNQVSELLMLGRSLGVTIWVSNQRPDSVVFPFGSRLNFGAILILGASIPSIYEMLIPEFIDKVGGREFSTGEGVLLLQGSRLHFVKIPLVKDVQKMQELCIKALS